MLPGFLVLGRPGLSVPRRRSNWLEGNRLSNWLFQGNPERYAVIANLMDGELRDYSWSIQRHAGDIKPGDKAALWIGGKIAGCVRRWHRHRRALYGCGRRVEVAARRGPRPPPNIAAPKC